MLCSGISGDRIEKIPESPLGYTRQKGKRQTPRNDFSLNVYSKYIVSLLGNLLKGHFGFWHFNIKVDDNCTAFYVQKKKSSHKLSLGAK